jgi:glutathione S-transferase
MSVVFYYGSGSPYAWRVWLALEHKQVDYEFKLLSFDAGDTRKPEFIAVNPRHQVPTLVDDGFAIYESAAIMEYVEERWPDRPRLFSDDRKQRAVERRMIVEADQYVSKLVSRGGRAILFTPPEKRSAEEIAEIRSDMQQELALWESSIAGGTLSGSLSAADYTLYPLIALVRRMGVRHPEFDVASLIGPRLTAWADRMAAMPSVQKTLPPHWKQ